MGELMRIPEAAKTFNLTTSKLYRYIRESRLNAIEKVKKGSVRKVKYIDISELKELLAL